MIARKHLFVYVGDIIKATILGIEKDEAKYGIFNIIKTNNKCKYSG